MLSCSFFLCVYAWLDDDDDYGLEKVENKSYSHVLHRKMLPLKNSLKELLDASEERVSTRMSSHGNHGAKHFGQLA